MVPPDSLYWAKLEYFTRVEDEPGLYLLSFVITVKLGRKTLTYRFPRHAYSGPAGASKKTERLNRVLTGDRFNGDYIRQSSSVREGNFYCIAVISNGRVRRLYHQDDLEPTWVDGER